MVESSGGSGGGSHASTLESTLARYFQALKKRWEETIYDAVTTQTSLPLPSHTYSSYFQPPWDHLNSGMDLADHFLGCKALEWFDSGRSGSVPDCCGFSTLLAAGEDWAWAARSQLFEKLPKFANHNLANLEASHSGFQKTLTGLGIASPESVLDIDTGGGIGGSLYTLVSECSADEDLWLANWTGLAANTAKEGYVGSALPTYNNHVAITAALSALYLMRAEIIENFRGTSLKIIDEGISMLGETVTHSEEVSFARTWEGLTGAGMASGVIGDALALSPIGNLDKGVKLAASTMRFLGWTGRNFFTGYEVEITEYSHSPNEVVSSVATAARKMAEDLEAAESEYHEAVVGVRTEVNKTNREVLELYDFGRNDPDGRGSN